MNQHQREWQSFIGDWESCKRNFSFVKGFDGNVTLTVIAATNLDTSNGDNVGSDQCDNALQCSTVCFLPAAKRYKVNVANKLDITFCFDPVKCQCWI